MWDGESEQPKRPLSGTNGHITAIAFSPDGQWLVATDDSLCPKIWEIATGAVVSSASFLQQVGSASSVAFTGRWILLANKSGRMYRIAPSSEKIAQWKDIHSSNIYSIEASPDGKYILTASKDMTVRITELEDMNETPNSFQHPRRVYCARFLRDGRIASCGRDETIRIWTRHEHSFREHTSDSGLAGPPNCYGATNRQLLAACSGIGPVALFSLPNRTWEHLPFVSTHSTALFAHDSKFVLFMANHTCGPDGVLRHREDRVVPTDIEGDGDLDLIANFGGRNLFVVQENDGQGHWNSPRLDRDSAQRTDAVLFVPTAGSDRFAKWEAVRESGQLLRVKQGSRRGDILTPGVVALASADFDHDTQVDLLVAAESDRSVSWYAAVDDDESLPERQPVATFAATIHDAIAADVDGDSWADAVMSTAQGVVWCRNQHDGSFSAPIVIDASLTVPARMEWADCDRDGRQDLIVATEARMVWYRHLGDQQFDAAAQPVNDLRSASWLLPIASTAVIWGVDAHRIEHHFSLHTDWIAAAAISPDDQWLATASRQGLVRIWRLPTGEFIRSLPVAGAVGQLLWSRDAKQLLVSSDDDVLVWERDGKSPRATWVGHENTVSVMAASHDGELVATASHDMTVRLWSLKTGACLAVLLGHKQRPQAACFSLDDRVLATLGQQGMVHLWHVPTGQELGVLKDWSVDYANDLHFLDEQTIMAVAGGTEKAEIGIWEVPATDAR